MQPAHLEKVKMHLTEDVGATNPKVQDPPCQAMPSTTPILLPGDLVVVALESAVRAPS